MPNNFVGAATHYYTRMLATEDYVGIVIMYSNSCVSMDMLVLLYRKQIHSAVFTLLFRHFQNIAGQKNYTGSAGAKKKTLLLPILLAAV